MLLRLCRPKVKPIEVPYRFSRHHRLSNFLSLSQLGILGTNLRQLAGIEPVTTAVGALIDLDPPLGAKEVPMQLNTRAARTLPFSGGIHLNTFVPFNLQQGLSCRLVTLIDLLQLKDIKPNPTATALANVNPELAHLDFSELVEASWAFHKSLALLD